jgi:hypothetical protein
MGFCLRSQGAAAVGHDVVSYIICSRLFELMAHRRTATYFAETITYRQTSLNGSGLIAVYLTRVRD